MSPDVSGTELQLMMKHAPSLEARHLFEIAALLHGVKATVRIVLQPIEIDSVSATLARLGLHYGVAPFGLAISRTTNLNDSWTYHVPRDDSRVEWLIVYAARDPFLLDQAFQFELQGSKDLGELLGYPQCCVKAYEENFSEGVDWVELLIRDWQDKHVAKGSAPQTANKLAYLFDGLSLLPDYFPCSLYCTGAAAIGAAHRKAALSCGLRDLVGMADAATARPIIVWRGTIFQPINYGAHGAATMEFDGDSALRFEWRPTTKDAFETMRSAFGCHFGSQGLSLLDQHGNQMGSSLDESGALILFSGTR